MSRIPIALLSELTTLPKGTNIGFVDVVTATNEHDDSDTYLEFNLLVAVGSTLKRVDLSFLHTPLAVCGGNDQAPDYIFFMANPDHAAWLSDCGQVNGLTAPTLLVRKLGEVLFQRRDWFTAVNLRTFEALEDE